MLVPVHQIQCFICFSNRQIISKIMSLFIILFVSDSASLGDGSGPGVFEPCHGSAPDLSGQNKVFTSIPMLTLSILRTHVGQSYCSNFVWSDDVAV